MTRIEVNLEKKPSTSYEIYIGQNILDRMGLVITKKNWASRYIIITDSNVSPLHGDRVQAALKEMGLKVDQIDFPAGEASKNIQTIFSIIHRMIEVGADRTSALIALGGGVVGDITGFVASIYMRGIPYIQVPTTLLAQVDSSIGGKTAIDLPQGKNILGTFHQPKGVFIDLAFLKTLPPREFGNGLAEIVKCGIIDDPELLSLLEKEAEAIRNQDMILLEKIIARTCRIKKGIVEIDEMETGLRRILNFGHTIGHAIEAESGYSISHGEAVSVGMVAAANISDRLKYLPSEDRERIRSLIRMIGLTDRIPPTLSTDGVSSRIKRDKKKEGDIVRFVLLKKIGVPFVNGGVPEALVRETIEALKK
jgi:3-dehydroquinate synthase